MHDVMRADQDVRSLEPVIDRLYEAVTDTSRWEAFLKAVAEAFDAPSASIIITDGGMINGVFSALYNLDPVLLDRVIQLGPTDPRVGYSFARPGKPFSDYREISAEALDNSPMSTEVLGRCGLKYTLGVAFVDAETLTAIAVYRPPAAPMFDEAESARFGILVPHLRRAVRLVCQFLKLEREKWAALEVLDTMAMGIAVVDAEGNLLHANVFARQILDRQDGLSLRHNQLWASVPQASMELRTAIRRAVEDGAYHQAMALPRRVGGPLMARVGGLHRNTLAGQPVALSQPVAVLYLSDPDRPQETMLELLQRLYGLTDREVELASRLAGGARLDDCVQSMGIAMPTARSHLRAIFGKTGAATQADLIRLVLSAPVWTPPGQRAPT